MQKSKRIRRRIAAVLATGCAGLALASAAHAVDLRDWGRKLAASERFAVILGNQAVLDKETQLVWQRAPSATAGVNWEYAKTYCTDGVFAGRRGWRLPSVHELSSLADPSKPFGTLALPTGHPFANVQAGLYWTVTRYFTGSGQPTGYAYAVFFNAGGDSVARLTTITGNYWCVRGGTITDN